eukprot:scaffold13108_cov55-Phaeocystis_antarctica.AAC.3
MSGREDVNARLEERNCLRDEEAVIHEKIPARASSLHSDPPPDFALCNVVDRARRPATRTSAWLRAQRWPIGLESSRVLRLRRGIFSPAPRSF